MVNSDLNDTIKRVRVECNNYDQTVQGIKALAHELIWDDSERRLLPDATGHIGRRMDTPDNNRLTPDLVVKISNEYGIIAEAKLTLPSNADYRASTIKDIEKYDVDLYGWSTPDKRIKNHDIILLVHHFLGREVQNQVNKLISDKELSFERKFSIVRFAMVEQAQTFLSLELVHGSLSDLKKQRKLENTIPIGLDHIAANPYFGSVSIYDERPPIPLLMQYIHEVILSNLAPDNYLLLRENNEVNIDVQIQELRQVLSVNFGPGQDDERIPEIPKNDWVKDAMGQFVKLGWAKKKERDKFIYILKKRRNHFDQFVNFYAKQLRKSVEAKARRIAREKAKAPLFEKLIEKESGRSV